MIVQRERDLFAGPRTANNGAGVTSFHVVAGLRREHGGPSYSIPALVSALTDAGSPARILTVEGSNAGSPVRFPGAEVTAFRHALAGLPLVSDLRVAPGLRAALRTALETSQGSVVHNHGLWLMPNVDAGVAARMADRPLVVSPRGMLSTAALSFSPVKKRVFWDLVQGPAFRNVSCWHATALQEYEEIRAYGIHAPVCVIPNGVSLPKLSKRPSRSSREILYFGRIHPKKGIETLVRAWAALEAEHSDWSVRIVGPVEDRHDGQLQALAANLGASRIRIEEAVYGEAKDDVYRDADLFVLPSLNENFGLTVAEALASATPVIATRGTPWSGLEGEKCGWWVDHGVDPMVRALGEGMALTDDERRRMGERGRAWIERDFSWDRIAFDMLDVYRWLVHGRPAPATVRLN